MYTFGRILGNSVNFIDFRISKLLTLRRSGSHSACTFTYIYPLFACTYPPVGCIVQTTPQERFLRFSESAIRPRISSDDCDRNGSNKSLNCDSCRFVASSTRTFAPPGILPGSGSANSWVGAPGRRSFVNNPAMVKPSRNAWFPKMLPPVKPSKNDLITIVDFFILTRLDA